MMSFGPPRRVVKDIKLGKDQTHEGQTHGESYRESHTGARFTSYTEKSLLVVKDYVFLGKNQNQDGANFGEAAFHGMPDGVNVPRYMWDTARSLARRDDVRKKKQKTWMPNGGGIKPYNALETQRILTPEDCIIDVKAVKPKVDTWFQPKNKRSISPEESKLNKTKETNHRRSPPCSPLRAATAVPSSKRANIEPAGRIVGNNFGPVENRGDSAVKNLTSYWNDHLKLHPFTMSLPQKPQKYEDVNGRRGRGDDWRKISQNLQTVQQSRPKSVGSDGVVQEHTLVPSKVLADRKMSSVEDIITFVKRSSTKKTSAMGGTSTEEHRNRSPARPEDDPLAQKSATCEKDPVPAPAPPPSPTKQPVRKPSSNANSKKSNDDSEKSNGNSRKSRSHNQHRHPLFVVRLHTRWMIAFKVLTLTFRPLVEAWKRKLLNAPTQDSVVNKSTSQKYELCQGDTTAVGSCRTAHSKNPYRNQKANLRIKKKAASQISCSSKIGRIKKLARRGMSDTLKFLSRTRRRKLVTEDLTKTPESCFAVTDQKGEQKSCFSFLTGRKPPVERAPLVTEPVDSSPTGPVVVYDEAESSSAKSASLEVLPRGLRMSLYVEYQLLLSFVIIQSALVLIVLFIKWLQEYTA